MWRCYRPRCPPCVAPLPRTAPRIDFPGLAPSRARIAWADVDGDEDFPTVSGSSARDPYKLCSDQAILDEDCSLAPRALSDVAPGATACGSPLSCEPFPTVDKHTGCMGGGLRPEACAFSPATSCFAQTDMWINLVSALNGTISLLNQELFWHRTSVGNWANAERALPGTAGEQSNGELCCVVDELRRYVNGSIGDIVSALDKVSSRIEALDPCVTRPLASTRAARGAVRRRVSWFDEHGHAAEGESDGLERSRSATFFGTESVPRNNDLQIGDPRNGDACAALRAAFIASLYACPASCSPLVEPNDTSVPDIAPTRRNAEFENATHQNKNEEASKEEETSPRPSAVTACLSSIAECTQAKLDDVASALSEIKAEFKATSSDFTRRLEDLGTHNVAWPHTLEPRQGVQRICSLRPLAGSLDSLAYFGDDGYDSACSFGSDDSDASAGSPRGCGSVVSAGEGECRGAPLIDLTLDPSVFDALPTHRDAVAKKALHKKHSFGFTACTDDMSSICSFCGDTLDDDLIIAECGSDPLCDECLCFDVSPFSGRLWCAHEYRIAKRADSGKSEWRRISVGCDWDSIAPPI